MSAWRWARRRQDLPLVGQGPDAGATAAAAEARRQPRPLRGGGRQRLPLTSAAEPQDLGCAAHGAAARGREDRGAVEATGITRRAGNSAQQEAAEAVAIAAVKAAESSGRRAAPSSRSAPVVVDSALQEAPAPAAPATRFDPKDIVGKKVKKHFTPAMGGSSARSPSTSRRRSGTRSSGRTGSWMMYTGRAP